MLSYSVAPLTPFVTHDKYMELTGLPKSTLNDLIRDGKVIVKKKKKRGQKILINMVAMHEIAAREAIEFLG